jgi:hypothetical protein
MNTIESAFTYVPGTTPLHRWSSITTGWGWRITSKATIFVICFMLLVQCSVWFSWKLALTVYGITYVVAAAMLAAVSSWHKTILLLRDTGVLYVLGVLIGLPLYVGGLVLVQLSGLTHGDPPLGAAATVVLLISLMSASLAIAAVFFSTTSIAALLGGAKAGSEFKYFIAIILTYFPRFEQSIGSAEIASRSLATGWAENSTRLERVKRFFNHFGLLIVGQVWNIVAISGPRYFLALKAREKEIQTK